MGDVFCLFAASPDEKSPLFRRGETVAVEHDFQPNPLCGSLQAMLGGELSSSASLRNSAWANPANGARNDASIPAWATGVLVIASTGRKVARPSVAVSPANKPARCGQRWG